MVLEIGTVLEVLVFTLDVFEKWDEHEARWMTAEDEKAVRWTTAEAERERNRILRSGFSRGGEQIRWVVEELRRQGGWNREAWEANGRLLLAVKGAVERVSREGTARGPEERERLELLATVLAGWRTVDLLAADSGVETLSQLPHVMARLSRESALLCSKAALAVVRSGVVVDCGLFATGCLAQVRATQESDEAARTLLREGAAKLGGVAVRMVEGQTLHEVAVVRWAALARVIELRRDLLRAAGERVALTPWQDGLAELRRALMQEGGKRSARSERLPLRTLQEWIDYASYVGKEPREIEVGTAGITVAEVISAAGVPGEPPVDAVGALLRLGSDARKGWERRAAAELGAEVRLRFPDNDPGGGNPTTELTTRTLREAEMAMIEIPLNNGFWMGSPGTEMGRSDNEKRHFVRLTRRYAMADVPVTQRLYYEVMKEEAAPSPSFFKGDDLPVEQVTWGLAVEFCNKLSDKDGLQRCYSKRDAAGEWRCNFAANGYRLATEAEWEYAAHADDIYLYSGGSDPGILGWYDGNSRSKTHPVRQKKPNRFGMYDMSGNVWEWCWDVYSEYPNSSVAQPAVDPVGPAAGTLRVCRGGCWLSIPQYLRIAQRSHYSAGLVFRILGFRIVRSIG